jgi:hypothetical protein
MLEARTGTQVLQLRLHHCAKVSGRVVAEFDDATRLALEDEHHPATNLGSRHCHDDQSSEESCVTKKRVLSLRCDSL